MVCEKKYGWKSGMLLKFCFCLFLFSPLCISAEDGVYLTEEEYNQIQEALTLSETELTESKMELMEVKGWLTTASAVLMTVSSTPTMLSEQYEKRETFWKERNIEQERTIKIQNWIIKGGAIMIGILGGITIIRGF